jgi:hypothetical protein
MTVNRRAGMGGVDIGNPETEIWGQNGLPEGLSEKDLYQI